MGVEMPIPRGQNQSYQARGRGSGGGVGRGWNEKNYVQRSQSDNSVAMKPHQEHNMANWYAQVPNLTYKDNFWNKKDHIPRDEKPKSQENSKKESNSVNQSNKFTDAPNGISVVMCEYERNGVKNKGSKQIENSPAPPPLLATAPNPPANVVKASNQDQKNQQSKSHRHHHHRNQFPRNNNGANRGHQNGYFNATTSNTTDNASSGPNARMVASNKHNNVVRHSSNASPQRPIRGRTSPDLDLDEDEPPPERIFPERWDLPDDLQIPFLSLEVHKTPRRLFHGGRWDKLSGGIWDRFYETQQTDATFQNKIILWQYMSGLVKSSFPEFGLFLVGSTVTGFGSENSDVDMCLLVRQSHMDQRSEAVVHLEQLLSIIKHCEFIVNPTLIQAKVPILKFREFRQGFDVDLNCNNSVGIRNSHLLYCYSRLDWRVRPLVLVVKCWAHRHNINEAKNMTISSYSLVLMVIFFLQNGVTPPILPCLHDMYPEKFKPDSDVDQIDIHEQLSSGFRSANKQPLGQLLYDFLDYYTHFNYDEFAISVRLAKKVPIDVCRQARTYNNDPHQWKHLCIEEPFDLTNTARSVYDPEIFEKVKNVFQQSYSSLEKSYKIESIFNLDMCS